jgi:hypothetical protein
MATGKAPQHPTEPRATPAPRAQVLTYDNVNVIILVSRGRAE